MTDADKTAGLTPPLAGGCQCGGVRYEIAAEPADVYCCHCRECQKQASSAFGISVIVPAVAMRLVRGEPHMWSRPTDSGRTLECWFCPDCGSRLWHTAPAGTPEAAIRSVKGGSLDTPPDLAGAKHIWTSRKLAGVIVPADAEQWPEEPPG